MKKIFILILSSIMCLLSAYAQEQKKDPLNAIVKINAVYSKPNFGRPWLKRPQTQGSGSGVVIGGNRILTNAHNVSDATYITVVKENNGIPVTAKVEAVSHQCDLAILSVADKSFFDDITPFEIGETPPVRTSVLAVGYPIGGDGISITQGIISRIEIMNYTHSAIDSYLAAQIDAALNPGNSGGPIIYNDKVVGIAFQNASGNNLGYMIHSEIIEHFLKDLEDGKVDGLGDLQVRMQGLENPDTRRFLKMKEGQSGVLVYDVKNIPGKEIKLKDGDVIISLNGYNIMNNGNIRTPEGTNRFFTVLVHSKQMGESLNLKIMRDGAEKEISIEPTKYHGKIKPKLHDKTPSMFTVGGLMFTPLSFSYFETWKDFSKIPDHLTEQIGEFKTKTDEEIVVLTEVLGDEVNLGYQGFSDPILEEVNGKKILNMKDLAQTVDSLKDDFAIFKFKDKTTIVLDLNKAKAALPRIMENYGLHSDRSKDLQ